ncbi:MAG: hypothetical protein WBQ18_09530 [Solirubrobacteraceae bacterium]
MITAIREAGPAMVPEAELVTADDAELEAEFADDRVVVEPPPHPATNTSRSTPVTIHVTP